VDTHRVQDALAIGPRVLRATAKRLLELPGEAMSEPPSLVHRNESWGSISGACAWWRRSIPSVSSPMPPPARNH